jgi:hypothetical protein
VNVVLRLAVQQNALVVPNQAVQTGQDGTYVYVIRDDQTVEMRPVTAGMRVDQDLVIDKGLQVGETVVTEGQLRLAPGSRVQIGGPNGGGGRGGRGGKGRGGESPADPGAAAPANPNGSSANGADDQVSGGDAATGDSGQGNKRGRGKKRPATDQ